MNSLTDVLEAIHSGKAVAINDETLSEVERVLGQAIRTAYNVDPNGPQWIAYVSPMRSDNKRWLPPNFKRNDMHCSACAGQCVLV